MTTPETTAKSRELQPLELEDDEEPETSSSSRQTRQRTLLAASKVRDTDSDETSEDDDDDDDCHDDASEQSSADGGFPAVGLLVVLLIPFLMLALALTVVYVGRRKDTVATQVTGDSIWKDNEDQTGPATSTTSSAQDTPVPVGSKIFYLTETAAQQVDHYRNGTGLLLNIEIANQAGHAICHSLGHAKNAVGSTPSFDCLRPKEQELQQMVGYPSYYPWNYEETESNVDFVRNYYHMIAWRFVHPPNRVLLEATNLEDPNLLTILVVRDPLSRMLAYDAQAAQHWPAVFSPTPTHDAAVGQSFLEQWRKFSHSPYTDNFALRALVGRGCCHGSRTSDDHLESGKALLQRVSIILDMACLEDGLDALAHLLGLQRQSLGQVKAHEDPQERIPTQELYDYLARKNRADIELYQWAKSRALVACPQD